MSKKTVCEIPSRWSLDDYNRRNCTDRSHRHITRADAASLVSHGLAEWVRAPRHKGPKPIIRIVRVMPARGLSATIGGPLRIAMASIETRDWAIVMFRSIRMRRESPSVELGRNHIDFEVAVAAGGL